MVTLSSIVSSLIATAIWCAGAFVCIKLYRAHRRLCGRIEKLATTSRQFLAVSSNVAAWEESRRAIETSIEPLKHMMTLGGFLWTAAIALFAASYVTLSIQPTLINLFIACTYFVLVCVVAYFLSLLYGAIDSLQKVLIDALFDKLDEKVKSKGE